jgi:DNA modification methylase
MRLYYSDDAVTIYHGDCREVEALDLQADAVIADPPYNVGITYGAGTNDNREDYEEWTREWFDAVRTVAWKTVVFPGHGNLAMWFASFEPSAVGCWYKTNGGGRSLLGVNQWEPWLYWCGDQGALGGSDVIRSWVGTQLGTAQSSHPTAKPVDLMQGLVKKLRCEIVLDPFMGSGSTLVGAKNLGRKAIGIEIEERYCELAAERCSQYALELED